MFTSQMEARQFFIDKIAAQAVTEGVRLSDAESKILSFSSDAEPPSSSPLVETLKSEMSDEEYESKIAGLVERSWKRDIAHDKTASEFYREAYSVLNRGDHYLLIMINRALGRHLRPWWIAIARADAYRSVQAAGPPSLSTRSLSLPR
jgi:hypothetical protein